MHLLTFLIQGNYQIDHEVGEPDPYIVDLNSELSDFDEFTSTTLLKKEQKSVKLSCPNDYPQLTTVTQFRILWSGRLGRTSAGQQRLPNTRGK